MSRQPRILLLETPGSPMDGQARAIPPEWDVVHVQDAAQGVHLLRTEAFDGFFVPTTPAAVGGLPLQLLQAETTLEALASGVAVVSPDLVVTWANVAFENWCGGSVRGRSFFDALGAPASFGAEGNPLQQALGGRAITARLPCRAGRHLELTCTPLFDRAGNVTQLVCQGRDVTSEVHKQQKLDALHEAGRDLAELPADQLAEMSFEERLEVLKRNIRRFTHDLLHFDLIEIRLLDVVTGKLEPLLQEGMTAQASGRELVAREDGNGVTGYVAATGKSYLCQDAASDPHYLLGAQGARSSLTVPLIYHDTVIGTFNVEHPEPNGFSEDDLKYAELFSREIADALHTLELLSAEKRGAASQSVEAINRAVALPVDEILAAATTLHERYVGHEPEFAARIKLILNHARSIKQAIVKVGEDMAPPSAGSRPESEAHPRLRGLRVLVADNEDRIRRSAHAILGRYGCVVETARDGQEALTMARLSEYDAIFADIRLPDISGYEIFAQSRKAQPRARVILMTAFGYDPSHAIVHARQEGLKFVLYKPFHVDQLLAALLSPAEERPDSGT